LEKIEEKDEIQFIRWKWCEKCNNSGFFWRIWIYEILEVNESIKKVIIDKNWIAKEIEKEAIKNWMITIKENWIINALQGKTTIEEILIAVDEG
jgi:type IV pilus assembly protein PilB